MYNTLPLFHHQASFTQSTHKMNKFTSTYRTRSHRYHHPIIIIILKSSLFLIPSPPILLSPPSLSPQNFWFKFSSHKANSIPSLPHHHQASFTIHSSHLSTSSSHLIPLSFLLLPPPFMVTSSEI